MNAMIMKKMSVVLMLIMAVGIILAPIRTYAASSSTEAAIEEETEVDSTSAKAMAAAIAIGLAAFGGAIGMAWGIAKSVEGISRQPEAEGKIRTTLMLGLVFVETAIIYALIVAILIVFVI